MVISFLWSFSPAWDLGNDGGRERMNVIHSGGNGGVLCCVDEPATRRRAGDVAGAGDAGGCLTCPEHAHSPVASPSATDCVCNAGYTGENG
eukprot:84630-Rhodomonas_salina.1